MTIPTIHTERLTLIRSGNLASARVATLLGAVLTGQADFLGAATDVYTYR